MAKSRPEKTLADYAAIAISPVLIMLLVGSLVFFLAEATYGGQYSGRLRWILFWFVLASVLVSRIGIEQGTAQASAYGIALAIATLLFIMRFIDSYVIGAICLLAVVWWCTNKLTWDCTLIDDNEDASGEGLLKSTGLESDAEHGTEVAQEAIIADDDDDDEPRREDAPSWWNGFIGKPNGRDGRPHAPGKWVVYFSLAALPLFGFGQLMIPPEKVASRNFAFQLLWVYVASALALLVTTSFLGLRRYLRQRRLTMPAAVTTTWLGMGGGLIVVIMMLCVLLPRPNANYSMAQLIDKASSKVAKASKNAMMKGEAGKGDGKRIGKTGEGKSLDPGKTGGGKTGEDNEKGEAGGKSKPGGKQGDGKAKTGGGEKTGKNKGGKNKENKTGGNKEKAKTGGGKQGQKQKQQQDGERKTRNGEKRNQKDERNREEQQNPDQQKSDREKSDQQNQKRQDRDQQQPENEPQSAESKISQTAEWIGKFFKWLIYAIIAVVVLVIVFRHWRSILEGISRFFLELRNFFAGLFGWKQRAAGESGDGEAGEAMREPPRSFASFANPFHTGTAKQMAPKTVIAYTFEAFEAWAYEHGIERRADQTAVEFAGFVGERVEEIDREGAQLAKLYTRAAYAERQPTSKCFAALEMIWQRMSAESAATRRTGVGAAS